MRNGRWTSLTTESLRFRAVVGSTFACFAGCRNSGVETEVDEATRDRALEAAVADAVAVAVAVAVVVAVAVAIAREIGVQSRRMTTARGRVRARRRRVETNRARTRRVVARTRRADEVPRREASEIAIPIPRMVKFNRATSRAATAKRDANSERVRAHFIFAIATLKSTSAPRPLPFSNASITFHTNRSYSSSRNSPSSAM